MMSRQFWSDASWTPAIVPGLSSPYCQPTPALFTRMSTWPYASIAACTTFSPVSGSSRSPGTTIPLPPAFASTSFSRSSLRAVPTSVAPSRPNSSIVARPMPLLAPVMTATLSSRRPTFSSWSGAERRDATGVPERPGTGPAARCRIPQSGAPVGSDHEHSHHAWLAARVAPAVAGAVLHHGVARAQQPLGAIVQLQDHLAAEDHLEVDGVGGVHAGVVRLEHVEHPGQRGAGLLLGRRQVEVRGRRGALGRDHGEAEAKAVNSREVAAVLRLAAVAGEARRGVAAPQLEELPAGEQRDRRRLDALVGGEHRPAGLVMARHHPPDSHGGEASFPALAREVHTHAGLCKSPRCAAPALSRRAAT